MVLRFEPSEINDRRGHITEHWKVRVAGSNRNFYLAWLGSCHGSEGRSNWVGCSIRWRLKYKGQAMGEPLVLAYRLGRNQSEKVYAKAIRRSVFLAMEEFARYG